MLSKEKNKLLTLLGVLLLCAGACTTDESSSKVQKEDSTALAARHKEHLDSLKKKNPLLIAPPDPDYTGTYIDRYDNGIVKYRGFYRFGKKHGQWLSFYPTGTAWSELHFDQDRREGPNITYYPNGKVRYTGVYRNDLRDSVWTYYDSTGKVAERVVFRNDRISKRLGPE